VNRAKQFYFVVQFAKKDYCIIQAEGRSSPFSLQWLAVRVHLHGGELVPLDNPLKLFSLLTC